MSIGIVPNNGGRPTKALECNNAFLREAIRIAVRKNIPVVVTAGNDKVDACYSSPGNEPMAFTVGATDITDTIHIDSNDGICLDMFAPGVNIESAWPNNQIYVKSASSYAAPFVAGVFAAYLSNRSYGSAQELYDEITNISTKNIRNPENTINRLLYVPY